MGHAQHSMVRAKPRAAQEAEGALRRGGEVRQQCCGATSVPGTPGKEKHPRQWEQPGQRCRSRNAHGVSGGTTSCSMGEVALLLLEGALALLLDRSPAPGFAPSRRLSDQLHSFPSKLCRCELAAKWGPRENPEGEHSSHKAGPWGPPAAGVICPGVWGRQVALGSGWDQCGLLSQERLPQALEIRPSHGCVQLLSSFILKNCFSFYGRAGPAPAELAPRCSQACPHGRHDLSMVGSSTQDQATDPQG